MKSAIRKMGNSHGVIIPKPLLEEIGAKANDPVEVKVKKGKIVISRLARDPTRRVGRGKQTPKRRWGWRTGLARIRQRGRQGYQVVKRGEVWLAGLDPTEGREIQKTRPCLIVSPPELHDFLDIVIVAPMTTASHPAPYRLDVLFNEKANRILLEQIRTIDKSQLLRRIGEIDRKAITAALATLQNMFAD